MPETKKVEIPNHEQELLFLSTKVNKFIADAANIEKNSFMNMK